MTTKTEELAHDPGDDIEALDAVAQQVRIGRETAAGDVAEGILHAIAALGYRRIPADCVVVPKEPTEAMIAACYGPTNRDGDSFRKAGTFKPEESYRAMIAAFLQPPEPQP